MTLLLVSAAAVLVACLIWLIVAIVSATIAHENSQDAQDKH